MPLSKSGEQKGVVALQVGTKSDTVHLRATQKIRAIALSGFGQDDDLRRSREAGFEQHLTKPIQFERLEQAAPAPEKPREPEKIKPPVLPPVKPLLKAVTPTPPAPVPTPVVAAAIAPPLSSAPSPIAAAAPAAAAPAVPVAPPVTANVVDPALAYNAKLTAAAQAAFEVPGAVTALAFKGRARVEFNLRDAVASSIHIVQSSGLGAMDRAALKAVQNAAFPQPPASLQGKEMRYQIWVTHDTHL